MKLKSGGYQPEFPTQSNIPPMPPKKDTQLFIVRIMFYEKHSITLYNVIKVDTKDKDFIIVYDKDNITSFYNKKYIEELHISPQ